MFWPSNYLGFVCSFLLLSISAYPAKNSDSSSDEDSFDAETDILMSPPLYGYGRGLSQGRFSNVPKFDYFGYQCDDTVYEALYVKKVADYAKVLISKPYLAARPARFFGEHFIFPLHPDQKTIWAPGSHAGTDRVVFDKSGIVAAVVRLDSLDSRAHYQNCVKIGHDPAQLPGMPSPFVRFEKKKAISRWHRIKKLNPLNFFRKHGRNHDSRQSLFHSS